MSLDDLWDSLVPAVARRQGIDLNRGTHQAALDELDRQLGPVSDSSPGPDESATPAQLDEARAFADAYAPPPAAASTTSPSPVPAAAPAPTPAAPIATPVVPVPVPLAPELAGPPEVPETLPSTPPPQEATRSSAQVPTGVSGAEQVPAPGPRSEAPAPPPTPEAAPPRNPLMVPEYARAVNQGTSRSDEEAQRRRNELSVQAAELRANSLEEQAAVELAAQEAANRRIAAVQEAQDRARAELSRRSDVLARAAEQRLSERPGAQDRASGRALLAVAAGMGSKSAEDLFNASLAEEERNERNDISRRQADMDALSKSVGAAGDQFQMLGASALNEQSLANAQSVARERVAIRQLEKGIGRLAPGEARAQGEQLVNDLKRKAADRELALAHAEVAAVVAARALQPTPSVPGHEPVLPERKADDTDDSYRIKLRNYERDRTRYELQVRSAGAPARSGPPLASRMMSGWEGMSPTGRGTPVPQTRPGTPEVVPDRGTKTGPSPSGPSRSTAKAAGSTGTDAIDRLFDAFGIPRGTPRSIAKGTARGEAAPSTIESRAEELLQRDKAARFNIPVPAFNGGRPFELSTLPGKSPDPNDENTKKLRTNMSKIVSFQNKMAELATIVTTYNGKSLAEFLGQYASKVPGLTNSSKKEEVEAALRSLLQFELSKAQDQGVIREAEQPAYEKMISSDKLFNQNPEAAAAQINAVRDFFTDKVADEMHAAGYDESPFRKESDRVGAMITGLGRKPVGPEDETTRRAEGNKARSKAQSEVDAIQGERGSQPKRAAEFESLFERPDPWSGAKAREHFTRDPGTGEQVPINEAPVESERNPLSRDHGTFVGNYQRIAEAEMRRSKAIEDYERAIRDKDPVAATEANRRRLEQQAIQTKAAWEIMLLKAGRSTQFHTSTPEMQERYLGGRLKTFREPPASDWTRYRGFIRDLLDTNGSVIGDFKD